MIEIYFRSIGKIPTKKALLKKAAQRTLLISGSVSDPSLTIIVSNDLFIQKLNRQYRNTDAPTDVLSFSASIEQIEPENIYLGDIVISYPTALSQATVAGHPVDHELCLLVIHGVLHLLGYDHHTPSEKSKTWEMQRRVLADLGIPMNQFSGDEINV